ncbi:MAG: alpha/beta hydrolase [Planctomycetota bacterium]|jgi:pimeloyl-ACP methyl ester carboxylesterase
MKGVIPAAVILAALVCPCAAGTLEKESVELTASDGMKVSGSFVKGSGKKGPAVVLLHMLGGGKEDWDPILDEYLLRQTPFSYLAIDLRGHGGSTAKGEAQLSWRSLTDSDFRDMLKDVEAAVKYLRGRDDVDGDRIAVVGASIGANLAVNYAARDKKIKGAALLSGALDYRGVTTARAIAEYGARPIFFAAAREDAPAGPDLDKMAGLAKGRKSLRDFSGNLHGTRMFGLVPVDRPLAEFLKDCLE